MRLALTVAMRLDYDLNARTIRRVRAGVATVVFTVFVGLLVLIAGMSTAL